MPIVFDNAGFDACCPPERVTQAPPTPPPPPLLLTCCPCAIPLGAGIPDPANFCTEFLGGVIAPFVVTANDPGFTLGTTGDDVVLDFDGTQDGGALFLEAPGPLVNPAIQGSFCFCAVMAQNTALVSPNSGGAYVGLSSGPFNESLLIVTVDNQLSLPLPTYHVQIFEGGGPTNFLFNTGILIDGTPHKFQICRSLTSTGFFLIIDNGVPIPVDAGFLPGPMVPFIGINGLGAALNNPFSLTVDSYCASSLIVPP